MKVEKVEVFDCEDTEVFDIGVEHNHNFYVYAPGSDTGVLVHNCHSANAPTFTKVMSNVLMKFRYGVTATPDRKDGMQYRVRSVIGPTVAATRVKELVPKITLHRTGDRVHSRAKYSGKGGWVKFCKFLAAHPDRNDTIFKWICKDLDAGRSIAIPITFTDHARSLCDRINEHYGKEIAAVFLGGAKEAKKRKPIVDAARLGDIRVVIGTRKLMQRGINIPRWDTLYYVMPMNNKPNWKQESCRILTPMENKRTPVIRMFIDPKVELAMGCAKSVLKMCWEFGYAKAKRTPKKLRNWMGIASDSRSIEDNALPDFFEPEQKHRAGQQRSFQRRW